MPAVLLLPDGQHSRQALLLPASTFMQLELTQKQQNPAGTNTCSEGWSKDELSRCQVAGHQRIM